MTSGSLYTAAGTYRIIWPMASTIVGLILALTVPVLAQRTEPRYDPKGQLDKLDSALRRGMDTRTREEDEDIMGRTEWFYFQRSFPYDMIPAGSRRHAIHEIHRLEQRISEARAMSEKKGAGIQAASQWQQIGPYNVAGRIRAIAAHPTAEGTIYIGAAAGGVWKNEGEGTVWTALFDNQSAIAVNAIAIDHSTPSTVYVGTGEIHGATSTPNASPAYFGDGIFKSTDDGATWRNIGLNNVGAVSDLFVHRQNPAIVYATATQVQPGFYRSTDGGGSWSGPSPSGNIYDMAVNERNSNTLFISGANFVRRSLDGGRTFVDKTSGITTGGSPRISVAMGVSDTNVVYAMVARSVSGVDGQVCEIYRSNNRGDSWTRVQSHESFSNGNFFRDQGWYNQCFAVAPNDPDIVVAGGIDVCVSFDGGQSWTNTTNGYSSNPKAHVDQHVAVFDDNTGLLYLGNDGGCYRSFDAGSTWERLSLALPITQFYSLDVDQTRTGYAYGGTQDNNTIGSTGPTEFNRNWADFIGGDGFDCAVDQTNPNLVYGENYSAGTRLYRFDITNPSERVPIDGNIFATGTDFGIWSTPLAQSPADKNTLYSGRRALWRSTNPRSQSNPSWQRLVPGNGALISAIGLSPHDATKMIIGSTSGELRFSTTDGASWSASTGVTPRYITSLLYDPVNSSRVYVTTSGTGSSHVYRSDNNGATFTSISSNLPQSLPINTIEVDPANTDHIFVGSDAGMFVTLDGGDFWFPFNDGFPLAPVLDMKIHRSTRMLIAATHGRSMFQVSLDNVTVQPLIVDPTGGETFTTPGKVPVRWAGFSGAVRVRLSYDGGGSYPVVVDNVSGGSVELDVPFVKTTNAVVRVEAMDGSVSVSSGAFSLNPQSNVENLGAKGLRSEAIAIRGQQFWATQRGSDSIVKLRLPSLSPIAREYVRMTGITGVVRDMAYDATADVFYMLTGNADYSNARVFRMDTLGAAQGEVTLPTSSVSGITMTAEGLALITPGTGGKLYVIDPANGSVKSESTALENAQGSQRAGLEWDGFGFVQGVSNAARIEDFASELQRISGVENPHVTQFRAVVLPAGGSLNFFGLAYDGSSSPKYYYATDTAGVIYRFTMEQIFSGVNNPPVIETGASTMAIRSITPNPFRGTTEIEYELRNRDDISIDLYSANGMRVRQIYSGVGEPGMHRVQLSAESLPGGVYYVAITNGKGERTVGSVVVMK